jgi:ABC-2 type transport system permease protein
MSPTLVLGRATRLELRKLRRTLLLRVALGVPACMVALAIWAHLLGLHLADRGSAWATYIQGDLLFWWGLFVLPPQVALIGALLADLDHRGDHWRRLFALPVPRWGIFGAKLLVGGLLLGLGDLLLALGAVTVGLGLAALRLSDLPLSVDWAEIVSHIGASFLASWLALAIQLWVAVRWRGLALPLGLGLVGAVIGLVLGLSPRTVALASVFPWTAPFVAGTHSDQAQLAATALGLVGGLAVGIAGCWEVSRRDVV